MNTTSSDIIELWFCWSVSQWDGNYQKELAKLAIAGNLVEILRGGAGYYWHIWCLHGRLFVKYLQLLRGRTKETSVKGQINIYPPWQNTMKMKTWKHNLTKICSGGRKWIQVIDYILCDLCITPIVWASDMGIRTNCVFGEIYQKSILASLGSRGHLPPTPKLDTGCG